MKIELLRVHHLRNLEQVELYPGPGINFYFGRNGAGKTSLLEAIYLLGRGSTYRGSSAGPLIAEGSEFLEVFARAKKGEGEGNSVGIWKDKKETRIKLNGVYIRKLSELARNIPLQIITTQSHDFFIRGPGIRRRFMDWGLFHVEHHYQEWFRRYRRILEQRNAALKQGAKDAAVWDEQLREFGEKIHQARLRYVDDLRPVLRETAERFLETEDLVVGYYPGWPTDMDYVAALKKNLVQDLRRGHTSVGVHKADLRLVLRKHPVEKILSRGQQKLLVASLLLSQAERISLRTANAPIILFDDISAELDKENLRRLLEIIHESGHQTFANSTENQIVQDMGEIIDETRMFHVEHGAVTSIN